MRLASRFGYAANQIRRDRPLTHEELMHHVPGIFGEDKHTSRSQNYTYIPTITVLESLQREGFQPFFACQTRVRDPDRREYTKHMLRLRRAGEITGQHVPEIILLNSHDGTSSYQMLPGYFRFVCQNGCVCGQSLGEVRVPDAHEALIARQDFELVQRIKGLDTRTSPNEDTVYLFSGILICGCCGSRMTRKTNRANGKEYHYYYCPTGKKKGCAHPVMLKESSLIDCVRDSLKAYIGNIASLKALLSSIDQSSINQALAKEYSDHITDNERRLEQVLEFKARLYESLVGGMLTKEEYASYKAKYTKQAEDIRESVRVLKEKLTEVLENRSERNRWISQFTQFSTLETLDRRALIHMVQSIRVRGKKELDITFTHEDEYKKALRLLALAAQQKDYEQRKVG